MSTWNEENPCFNCQVVVDNKKRQAPCCYDIVFEVTPSEFDLHFKDSKNVELVNVVKTKDGKRFMQISIHGPCPQIDLETGKCSLEGKTPPVNQKPEICSVLQPGKFYACVRSPVNRYDDPPKSDLNYDPKEFF
ncbi:MAG: hypothetical protein V1858_03570 [Candidatus Gottesmanbacteria bacterium]